jgi:hypothetical protein
MQFLGISGHGHDLQHDVIVMPHRVIVITQTRWIVRNDRHRGDASDAT